MYSKAIKQRKIIFRQMCKTTGFSIEINVLTVNAPLMDVAISKKSSFGSRSPHKKA